MIRKVHVIFLNFYLVHITTKFRKENVRLNRTFSLFQPYDIYNSTYLYIQSEHISNLNLQK